MRPSDFLARASARGSSLALLACTLWCVRGAAEGPAPEPAMAVDGVQLSIPDCEDIPGSEIAKIVALELAPRQTPSSANPEDTSVRASVRCSAAHATIEVEDARRPHPLVLELELAATPREARPRLLALAVAELIATSRLERVDARTSRSQPSQPAPAPAPSESARPAGPGAKPRLELFLEVGATRAFDPALYAPAVTAGVAGSLHPFALIFDVAYERGQARTADAAVSAQTFSLSLAPAVQAHMRSLTFSQALGLRGGYARLEASPRTAGLTGRALSGLFLAPIADSSLQLRIARHWAARVAIELGYVVKPLRGLDANQGSLLELRGLRLAALLGIAWAPF